MAFSLKPVGVIRSCFKDKFGVPRQPGLVPSARAVLEFLPPFDREEACLGIDDNSHLWIQFVFHQCIRDEPNLTVRPPRLGGNRKLGVFASRATFRPNPLGLSVVELERVEREKGKVRLHLKGIDLVDGTPVLDVKPYLPYVDSVPQAQAGFAQQAPGIEFSVEFSPSVLNVLHQEELRWPGLAQLIEEVVRLDPRPAYFKDSGRNKPFAICLHDLKIRWRVLAGVAIIDEILPSSML